MPGQLVPQLKGLVPAFLALIGVVGVTAGVFAILGAMNSTIATIDIGTIKKFILVLGVMTGLIAAFTVLSLFSAVGGLYWWVTILGLIPAFVALAGVIGATAGVFKILGSMNSTIATIDIGTIKKFILILGVMTGLIAAFTVLSLFSAVGGLYWGFTILGLIPAFIALAGVIGATAGVFKILGAMNSTIATIDIESIKKFILVLGVMTGLIAAFALLGPLLALLGVFSIFAISGVITAIAAVGLIMAGFVGMAYVANKLVKSKDDLQNGIDILVLIGEGIGRFAASFISGATIESLSAIGRGIADFSKSISEIKNTGHNRCQKI